MINDEGVLSGDACDEGGLTVMTIGEINLNVMMGDEGYEYKDGGYDGGDGGDEAVAEVRDMRRRVMTYDDEGHEKDDEEGKA